MPANEISDINEVKISGRIITEVFTTETKTGGWMATFTIANNVNKNGVRHTSFVKCVAWNETARLIAKNRKPIKKGSFVQLLGMLSVKAVKQPDGSSKIYTQIVLDDEDASCITIRSTSSDKRSSGSGTDGATKGKHYSQQTVADRFDATWESPEPFYNPEMDGRPSAPTLADEAFYSAHGGKALAPTNKVEMQEHLRRAANPGRVSVTAEAMPVSHDYYTGPKQKTVKRFKPGFRFTSK